MIVKEKIDENRGIGERFGKCFLRETGYISREVRFKG